MPGSGPKSGGGGASAPNSTLRARSWVHFAEGGVIGGWLLVFGGTRRGRRIAGPDDPSRKHRSDSKSEPRAPPPTTKQKQQIATPVPDFRPPMPHLNLLAKGCWCLIQFHAACIDALRNIWSTNPHRKDGGRGGEIPEHDLTELLSAAGSPDKRPRKFSKMTQHILLL